jgi:sec-independent protein translocase protein TatB
MNLGFSEMVFIFLIALIIFGPRKLPEIGRQVGKALAEFKRASNEFKSQLETEMRQIEIEEALRKEKESLAQAINPFSETVASGSLSLPEATPATTPAVSEASEPPRFQPPAENPLAEAANAPADASPQAAAEPDLNAALQERPAARMNAASAGTAIAEIPAASQTPAPLGDAPAENISKPEVVKGSDA